MPNIDDYLREPHTRMRYAGRCYGGPYDGQMRAEEHRTFEVAMYPKIGRPTDDVDMNSTVKYGRYEYVAPTEAKWIWKE